MKLGIDGSNIRSGGGVTHLIELLDAANPRRYGFNEVIVWSGTGTLSKIKEREWLNKSHDSLLDRPLPYRIYWQRFKLNRLAKDMGCNVLFVPENRFIAISGRWLP